MKNLFVALVLIVCFNWSILKVNAEEPKFIPFTADVVSKTECITPCDIRNFPDIVSKMYFSKDKFRQEEGHDLNSLNGITVYRKDTNEVFELRPVNKEFVLHKDFLQLMLQKFNYFLQIGDFKKVQLDDKWVNNYSYTTKIWDTDTKINAYYQQGTTIPFRIESEYTDRVRSNYARVKVTMYFLNIIEGESSSDLFEIPSDYTQKKPKECDLSAVEKKS